MKYSDGRNSYSNGVWRFSTTVPLTPAFSPEEREKVSQRLMTASAFDLMKTECRFPLSQRERVGVRGTAAEQFRTSTNNFSATKNN